jgi:hypothetical protein
MMGAAVRRIGEVSERLKEHAWKVCIRQRIEGSNPSLSAIFYAMGPCSKCRENNGIAMADSTSRDQSIGFGAIAELYPA